MKKIVCSLVGAAWLISAMSATAAENYRGVLSDNVRQVPIVLVIGPHQSPGDDAGQIRFGEPWKCSFELEFAGSTGAAETYSFKSAGAGRCAAFTLGYLRSESGSQGLRVEIFDQNNVSRYTTTLGPVAQ